MPIGAFRSDSANGSADAVELTFNGSVVYLPVNTRSIRLNLAGTRTSGTQCDCWWDDLVLKLYSGGAWTANLFVNPGAESAPGAEWSSVPQRQLYSQYSPYRRPLGALDTNYYYFGANAASFATYQDVDVSSYAADIDAGTCKIWFDGWFGNYANDDYFTTMNLEYRQTHPGGTVLGTRTFNPFTNWKLEIGWPGFIQLGFGYERAVGYLDQTEAYGLEMYSSYYYNDEDLLVKTGTR